MRRKTLAEAIHYAGGSEALDTLETVTSLGENVPGVIGRISRIANVGARIGQTAEKEKKLMELQNELKRRTEAQHVERQAIMRKYAPTSQQQVRNQFNFFRFMENPTAYKQRQRFLKSQGRATDVLEAPELSQAQTRDLEALAQKYQIPQLMAEIQALQEELAADPISTDGITGVVTSALGGGAEPPVEIRSILQFLSGKK
jgi:hypothetical protein